MRVCDHLSVVILGFPLNNGGDLIYGRAPDPGICSPGLGSREWGCRTEADDIIYSGREHVSTVLVEGVGGERHLQLASPTIDPRQVFV